MRGNGNGGHEGDGPMQAEFDAALAAAPNRDRLDRLAIFASRQAESLRRAVEAQARAMFDLAELLNERFRLVEGEVERLKAERERDRRFDTGGEDDGGTLQ